MDQDTDPQIVPSPEGAANGPPVAAVEPATPAASIGPVRGAERVASVDVLRGFALLGILAMNIYAFAMPFAAYTNPLKGGGDRLLDYGTWVFTHLVFDQKFMTIFSMLFGAGLILMAERAEARGVKFAGVYYRREMWLILLGAAHGYFLWFGDILCNYGTLGLTLYLLRRRTARTLIIIGCSLLLVAPLLSVGFGTWMHGVRGASVEAESLRQAGEEPSPELVAQAEMWDGMASFMDPSPEAYQEEVRVHLEEGWWGITKHRAPMVLSMQTSMLLFFGIWRIGGLMVLGMGLMKAGVFSAARSRAFYLRTLVIGYTLGFALVGASAKIQFEHGFDVVFFTKTASHLNYFGSLLVGLGHICLVMLACQKGLWLALQDRLAAVGRMALTNYLLHSAILTTVFYGYGLGLFDQVSRFAQMGFVLAVWAFQLWISPIWLARYRFGPVEWLWRSLTYWQRQPFVRRPSAAL